MVSVAELASGDLPGRKRESVWSREPDGVAGGFGGGGDSLDDVNEG